MYMLRKLRGSSGWRMGGSGLHELMKQDEELGSLSAVAPENPSSAVKDRGLTSLQPMQ